MSHNTTSSPTLGVVAISKNEECDMPGFLAHLVPWVDEIIVVDDASTDRTLEIVRAAGPKVRLIEHPMDEDQGFAGQRNVGIDAATAEWLLHMDIDMRVTPELAGEMFHVIQDSHYNAYRFRLLNFFLHRPMRTGGWERWNQPWLARRGAHRFGNRVHEACQIDGAPGTIGQLNGLMWHLNDANYQERLLKNARYTPLTAQKILDRGIKIRWYHILLHPFWKAFQAYVLRGAFRQGTQGIIFSMYVWMSGFNHWASAWEKQNHIDRECLEKEIAQQWSSKK